MSCCPPGSWPVLEDQRGSFNGRVEDLGSGLQAYVVQPAEPTGYGIISFQDIKQYDTGRNKSVMDQFAESGFTVVHVDFTGDNFYDGEFDATFYYWVQDHSYTNFIKPKLVRSVFPYMKKTLSIQKIFTIGFCWGCYIAFQACADPDLKDSILASALFHPTLGLNRAFDKDPECRDVAEHVSTPQLFVVAGNDPDFLGPNGSVMRILQKKSLSSKSVVMKDMKHGFVNRGDVSVPSVKRGAKEAVELAMAFLKDHLD